MNKRLVQLYKGLLPNWIEYLGRELKGYRTVLDLGCGANSVLCRFNIPFTMGIDACWPCIVRSGEKALHSCYIQADITELRLEDKCVDAIIAIEVLEHIGKDKALELLKNMESWARHKVVVKVPNGFIAQGEFNGNPYQEHKSGWTQKELESLGYRVTGMSGWKALRGTQGKVKIWPYFIGDRISDLTQPIIYHRPQYAFQLFGVKSVD